MSKTYDERIKTIQKTGLIEAVRKWLMPKKWLKIGEIKKAFHTSGVVEKHIIRYLIEEGSIEKKITKYCGYRVFRF